MDDPVVLQAVLTLWAGIFAGCVLGALTGWRTRFALGMAIGLLTIGIGGLAGAAWLGWHRYQSLQGTELVAGVLTEWVAERSADAYRSAGAVYAPVVRFRAQDGETYSVKGLGRGMDEDLPPGSAIRVRYRVDDPRIASIADFQNQWGGVWAIALFGAIPGMMGAFFLRSAFDRSQQGRHQRQPARLRLTPQRRKLAQRLTIAGNALFLLSFAFAGFTENIATAIGIVFLTIGAACAVHATASSLRHDEWQTFGIFLIIGSTFALFGFGAVMLG